MKRLGWNEIYSRAIKFVYDWKDITNEKSEAQSFLNEFLYVFGVNRRKVAYFENPVEKANGHRGYIDMLWKGKLLVEMKTRGKNLEEAYNQAMDYILKLKDYEVPEFIMICDFKNIHLYNLDTKVVKKITIDDLPNNIKLFSSLAGYNETNYEELIPLSKKAAYQMGLLHDQLKEIGYDGHALEVYLVRLLFCLFAENTALFESRQFNDYITDSREDGQNLARKLEELFEVLNTPIEKRLKTLDEDLNLFPYVNGKLFEEKLPIAGFNSDMRNLLIKASHQNWGGISPAIFGSMFQSVMNIEERRNLGAHYTSEENILKVIKPLFLDDLWKEFDQKKNNKKQLKLFHDKLSKLTFLDPACGCGNFLIVTYRELRRLELKILKITEGNTLGNGINGIYDINLIKKVSLKQFYGIEYTEFPSQIAKVAMWIIEHQMNIELSNEFGQYANDLPLVTQANIICENALTYDWEKLINPEKLTYIIGNPPYLGKKEQDKRQKKELKDIFENEKGSSNLDYVTSWYVKASKFIQGTNIRCAFVSTNSITQGEQVNVLWKYLFERLNIEINFAYTTFKWGNNEKDNAGVYCVIIGFSIKHDEKKYLFINNIDKSDIFKICVVDKINQYLLPMDILYINKRDKPICDVPIMSYGSIGIDDKHLKINANDKDKLIKKYPELSKYIRPIIGGKEILKGSNEWCLWLVECPANIIKNNSFIKDRVKKVKSFRESSNREATKKLAEKPYRFGEIRQPDCRYIAIPKVSSENRVYIPAKIFTEEYIANGSCLIIPTSDLYIFGLIQSYMHMVWVKYIGGRLEMRYQYSSSIVYNNFPFPDCDENQKQHIRICAEKILRVREKFSDLKLEDLYDNISMPEELLNAHKELDKVVDKSYSSCKFKNDIQRMKLLFEMHEKIIKEDYKELAYAE